MERPSHKVYRNDGPFFLDVCGTWNVITPCVKYLYNLKQTTAAVQLMGLYINNTLHQTSPLPFFEWDRFTNVQTLECNVRDGWNGNPFPSKDLRMSEINKTVTESPWYWDHHNVSTPVPPHHTPPWTDISWHVWWPVTCTRSFSYKD